MNEKILVISNQAKDGNLFKQILGSKGFDIVAKPIFEGIEDILSNNNFGAILADYDQVGDLACNWIKLLQENRSQSCVILYGENKKQITGIPIHEIGFQRFSKQVLMVLSPDQTFQSVFMKLF